MMKNTQLLKTALFLTSICFCQLFAISAAQAKEWEILGMTTVNKTLDRDEIKVKLKKGALKKIKIKVRVASLEMKKCFVHFRNGDVQEVWLRDVFKKGTESRAIDLDGEQRFIEKVVFWYAKNKEERTKAFSGADRETYK